MENKAPKPTICRVCGAQIRFIRTARGKWMPCDSDPMPYRQDMRVTGKDKLITPEGHVILCEILPDGANAHGYGFVPHFATCPAWKH